MKGIPSSIVRPQWYRSCGGPDHSKRSVVQVEIGELRVDGLEHLSELDARAVEQVLIETFGLQKNGGMLLNRINSIAQSNPVYGQSIARGIEILQTIGFPGF